MSSDATDNTMRAELLPCPFCRSAAKAGWHSGSAYLWCLGPDCCASMGGGDSRESEEELTASWNRRDGTARQVAEAVAAEGEACAALCAEFMGRPTDEYEEGHHDGAEKCRDAIRARATPATGEKP